MSLLLALLATSALADQPSKRPSDAERGEELWERHCTACHGPTNRGDGPATEALVVTVPDLRGKVKVDEATIKLVLRGMGGMPAYETSFDKTDARRVLKHMATVHEARAKKPKPPTKRDDQEPEPDEANDE
jgi:mono/diheme cytochrome c family protein